jgi:hypothetical protein
METAVAAVAAQGYDVLIIYFLIIAAIAFSIICVLATSVAIALYIVLWAAFFSVIRRILNVQICVLTGAEPGTCTDGINAIADIIAVALIVLAIYYRPPIVGRDANDDDEDEDG